MPCSFELSIYSSIRLNKGEGHNCKDLKPYLLKRCFLLYFKCLLVNNDWADSKLINITINRVCLQIFHLDLVNSFS